jgi:hypothetical protein
MKALAIIWVAVLISGIATVTYISHALDVLVIEPFTAYQVQPAEQLDLGNSTCVQNCQPAQLQPAIEVK